MGRPKAEIRQIEPFVYSQSTHSRFSPRYGASCLPWLSGAAAWAYYAATQYLLGIKPDYDGLIIDPCIPSKWKGFSVTRIFRKAKYTIVVKNPDFVCKGIKQIYVYVNPIE